MGFKTDIDNRYRLVKVTVTFKEGRGRGVHAYSVEAETEEIAKEKVVEWLEYQKYYPEDYE